MDNGASSYRRFLQGDDSAFAEIIKEYRDGLILYLSSFVSGITDAEDLAEDTFCFVRDVVRRALHTIQVREADQAEPPKVINRITYPGDYPDFSFSGDDDLLEIWFPIIKDQDAAIFLYQDQVWMLDCGDERAKEEIVPLLRYLGLTRIDRIINTHPHHDHLNGLYSIHEAVPVEELMICFPAI